MIRNIIFDMGMVLLSYDPMQPCLRHAGDPEKARRLREGVFGRPDWGKLIDGGVMTDVEYGAIAKQSFDDPAMHPLVDALLKDWYLDGLYPKSGMAEVVDELLARGFALYVLSNAGYSFHQLKYKIVGLDRFSGVLLSCEEHLLKPDTAIYDRLCAKFDLVPQECLFIDDLPGNIEGAKQAGLHGYCFADGDVARLAAHLRTLEAPKKGDVC